MWRVQQTSMFVIITTNIDIHQPVNSVRETISYRHRRTYDKSYFASGHSEITGLSQPIRDRLVYMAISGEQYDLH